MIGFSQKLLCKSTSTYDILGCDTGYEYSYSYHHGMDYIRELLFMRALFMAYSSELVHLLVKLTSYFCR